MKIVTYSPGLHETSQITRVREYLQKHGGYKFVPPPLEYDPSKSQYEQTEAVQKQLRKYKYSLAGEVVQLMETEHESVILYVESKSIFRVSTDELANFTWMKKLLLFQTSGKKRKRTNNTLPFADDMLHEIVLFFDSRRDYFNLKGICKSTQAALNGPGSAWCTANIVFVLTKKRAYEINRWGGQKRVLHYVSNLESLNLINFFTFFPRLKYLTYFEGLGPRVVGNGYIFRFPKNLMCLSLGMMPITIDLNAEIGRKRPRALELTRCDDLNNLTEVNGIRSLRLWSAGSEENRAVRNVRRFYSQTFDSLETLVLRTTTFYDLFSHIRKDNLTKFKLHWPANSHIDLSEFLNLEVLHVGVASDNVVDLTAFISTLKELGKLRKLKLRDFNPIGTEPAVFPKNLEKLYISCHENPYYTDTRVSVGIATLEKLRKLGLCELMPVNLKSKTVLELYLRGKKWDNITAECPAAATVKLVGDTPDAEGNQVQTLPIELISSLRALKELSIQTFTLPSNYYQFPGGLERWTIIDCLVDSPDTLVALPGTLRVCTIDSCAKDIMKQILFNAGLLTLCIRDCEWATEKEFALFVDRLKSAKSLQTLAIIHSGLTQMMVKELTYLPARNFDLSNNEFGIRYPNKPIEFYRGVETINLRGNRTNVVDNIRLPATLKELYVGSSMTSEKADELRDRFGLNETVIIE